MDDIRRSLQKLVWLTATCSRPPKAKRERGRIRNTGEAHAVNYDRWRALASDLQGCRNVGIDALYRSRIVVTRLERCEIRYFCSAGERVE